MILSRTVMVATLGVLLAATAASAQVSRTQIYSRPALPSTEALRRLNLQMAWRAYVPMDGRRDGIIRVDLIGRDLFVVTRSGEVARFDQETGAQKWRIRVGKPYTVAPFLAANSRSVYAIANAEAFAIDRAGGTRKWEFHLRTALSTAPVVDEEQVYVPGSNSRLYAYYLPFVDRETGARTGAGSSRVYVRQDVGDELRPTPVWEEETNIQMFFQPLQTDNVIFVISPSGKGLGYSKVLREGARGTDLYSFSIEGNIRVPPGQFGDFAYIGSDDAALYSVNLDNGKLHWRHTTGTAITQRPVALEKDVFVTSALEGMARIDRESGDPMWRISRGREISPANVDANRFLAANDRFVYATDTSGRMLVLDRKRGTKLSMLDTSAYRVPIVNNITDRIYLASNDGLIVCLHDLDQVRPIRHQRSLERASFNIVKLLEQKVPLPATKEGTLRNVLADLRLTYKLGFVVVEAAFREAGNPNVQDKVVRIPKGGDNRALKDILKNILDQVDATYQVVDESVLIVPQPPKAPLK